MEVVEYHKLVRDKMPEIIEQDGWTPRRKNFIR